MKDLTNVAKEMVMEPKFTAPEQAERKRHIITLRNFAGASVAAAKALAAIRDKKLYRPHKSLKEFCQRECGFTEQRLFQIIKFAKVRDALPSKTKQLLSRESQTRELLNVPEEQHAEILEEAAKIHGKDGEITARDIRQAIAVVVEEPLDDTGKVVPDIARKYWDRRDEAKDVMSALRAAKRAVNALDINDLMWKEVNLNGVLADISAAINRFGSALPAYVCPYCDGTGVDCDKYCQCCSRRGVISKFMWDHAVPREMKK